MKGSKYQTVTPKIIVNNIDLDLKFAIINIAIYKGEKDLGKMIRDWLKEKVNEQPEEARNPIVRIDKYTIEDFEKYLVAKIGDKNIRITSAEVLSLGLPELEWRRIF